MVVAFSFAFRRREGAGSRRRLELLLRPPQCDLHGLGAEDVRAISW